MPEAIQNNKTVLETILEWSLDKPLWLRDALRRIVQKGKIDDADLDDALLLLKKHQSLAEVDLEAKPLAKEHLPNSVLSGKSVSLNKITCVKGVNNLASDQTLTFSKGGIT